MQAQINLLKKKTFQYNSSKLNNLKTFSLL